MSQWLKEPLFHFMFIGAGIFVLYGLTANEPIDEESRIEISSVRADRMVTLWEKRWNRPPTQEEFNGLTKAYIKEEVLYKEALAMGLDADDPVVRRRMAQKVEFISNDMMTLETPTDKELQAYLDAHSSKYQLAGEMSFKQVYFNPSKHDASMEKEARELLAKLSQENHNLDVSTLGDTFLHGSAFKNIKEFEVNRMMGKAFTKKLFEQVTNKWVGVISSSYGLHLLYIESKQEAKIASLELAREAVISDWESDERKRINEVFVNNLSEQYTITIAQPTSALLAEKRTK